VLGNIGGDHLEADPGSSEEFPASRRAAGEHERLGWIPSRGERHRGAE
jgi:hypothetical protein